MRKVISRYSYLLLLVAIFMVGFFVIFAISRTDKAQAAAGDIKVTVVREAGGALSGATVEILCAGGAYTQLTGSPTTNGSGIVQAAPQLASSCDNTDSVDIRVTLDGYVTKVATGFTYLAISDPNDFGVTDVQFSHKAIIKDELNVALTPTGATAGASATSCVVSTNNVYCPVPLADDNTVANGFVVVKDGYVTTTASDVPLAGSRSANADAQQVTTMTGTNGLDFSHKIIVKNELNAALTPDSATAGANTTACTVSTNSVYCPVPLADDNTLTNGFIVTKDGYVTASVNLASNRTAATDAQASVTMNATNGLDFAYKITGITSEAIAADLTATATSVRVGDATGLSSCTFDTDSWYCPVVLANSDGTMVARVYQDGYVQKDTYALTTGTTRLLNTTAQKTDTIAGIQYAVKATTTVSSSGVAVSGATVTAGDSLAVSCNEGGSTGIYYCAIPLADTGVVVSVVKSGYNNASNTFDDRAAVTDAQAVVHFLMYISSTSSGSGNTSQGSSGGSTGYATNPVTPAPVVENPATPTNAPETPKTDIVSIINQERDIVISQTNPENFFINSGTSTTSKLGSGERGAAISSYKEAYGIAPKSSANWVDVLNIANGRWPLTVNKAVEARAYTNFKLVYGRVADMKNSTDVNALKMMGYGVRSTKARDLGAERSAIAKFKATFGFGPSNARHWNIVRAIAYSGVIK